MDKKNEIKEDIMKYSEIDSVARSTGGQAIIKSLQKDIISSVNELVTKYKTGSHTDLIVLISKLSERLSLLRVLTIAKTQKKFAQDELDFLIKQEEL